MAVSVKKAMDGFTFGADPELFILNADGEIVSAEGIIPGTKDKPFNVAFGAVQVDGMAAEFNIEPSETFQEFSHHIETVMDQLAGMLPPGYTFYNGVSVDFSEKVWNETADKAKELGCSPDFNAWTGEVNPPPENLDNPRTRCAGGHIHIGWTEDEDLGNLDHINNGRDLVKQLDYYLGGWSLQHDKDPIRRGLYGKAGACRFKPYGVEYRVLSNFWIFSPNKRLQIWNRTCAAIEDMRKGYIPDISENLNARLVESINTSRRDEKLEDNYAYPLMAKI